MTGAGWHDASIDVTWLQESLSLAGGVPPRAAMLIVGHGKTNVDALEDVIAMEIDNCRHSRSVAPPLTLRDEHDQYEAC